MKQYLLLLLLLSACMVTRPVETQVSIQGDPQTFRTEVYNGNNSVNVTIIQSPSKLIYYPMDEDLLKDSQFSIECRDLEDWHNTFTFSKNLTILRYTGNYIESRPSFDVSVKYPFLIEDTFQGYKDVLDNLSDSDRYVMFSCDIKSNFKARYLEYIDGVLVENKTDSCDYFWRNWRGFLYIRCYMGQCEYVFNDFKERNFIETPSYYIMDNCFKDWTRTR